MACPVAGTPAVDIGQVVAGHTALVVLGPAAWLAAVRAVVA